MVITVEDMIITDGLYIITNHNIITNTVMLTDMTIARNIGEVVIAATLVSIMTEVPLATGPVAVVTVIITTIMATMEEIIITMGETITEAEKHTIIHHHQLTGMEIYHPAEVLRTIVMIITPGMLQRHLQEEVLLMIQEFLPAVHLPEAAAKEV